MNLINSSKRLFALSMCLSLALLAACNELESPPEANEETFGNYLALSGDTLAVGASRQGGLITVSIYEK